MSVFNNGGGTLNATTVPSALLELIELNEQAESADFASANVVTNLTYSRTGNQATFAVSMTATQSLAAAGAMQYTSVNDLPAAPFDPGAGGDLTATDLRNALIQVVELYRKEQAAASAGGVNVNRLANYTYNGLTGVLAFGGTNPTTTTIAGGLSSGAAVDF